MINKMIKSTILGISMLVSGLVNAALIVEYDLDSALGTSLNPSFVHPDYNASPITLTNADNNAAAFSNHFYHNGWDNIFNANKFYEATISSINSFSFANVSFSLENTGGVSTYWLRSSLDGFLGNISSGSFQDGDVTNFDVSLGGLGQINAPVTFRWYIASANTAGFANHECNGAGCGLNDIGQDIQFKIASVSEPPTLAVLAIAMIGLVLGKRRKQ